MRPEETQIEIVEENTFIEIVEENTTVEVLEEVVYIVEVATQGPPGNSVLFEGILDGGTFLEDL